LKINELFFFKYLIIDKTGGISKKYISLIINNLQRLKYE